MSALKLIVLQHAVQGARSIPKRVWLIGAGVLLGVTILAIWAGVALMGAAASQLPQLTEVGRKALDTATGAGHKILPELKQRAQATLAGLDQFADPAPPATDVSGADVGPVQRFPGLVREKFVRESGGTTVRYVGRASLPVVLDNYRDGFTSAGFQHQVVSAAPGRETHNFVAANTSATYELSLEMQSGGLLIATLKETKS